MTQYNSLNATLSNSQLNKLKSAIKNESEVILRLSSNMIGNSDDETNFAHKLLLTNRQVAHLRKAIANNLSANIKLSKTQLSKIIQSGGFIGRLKTSLLYTKNMFQPLAKSVSIPFGLTAAASAAADTEIHKKILGSGTTTTLMSHKEMEDIMKIVKSLEDSGLLIKTASEMIQDKGKEQKSGFSGMLLGTLGASLLGNILTGKGVNRARDGII